MPLRTYRTERTIGGDWVVGYEIEPGSEWVTMSVPLSKSEAERMAETLNTGNHVETRPVLTDDLKELWDKTPAATEDAPNHAILAAKALAAFVCHCMDTMIEPNGDSPSMPTLTIKATEALNAIHQILG